MMLHYIERKILRFRLTPTERSDIIKSLDATILDAVKDTEIDTEIEESGEIGELIHELIVKFDTVLN